jgi:hypothetical protein
MKLSKHLRFIMAKFNPIVKINDLAANTGFHSKQMCISWPNESSDEDVRSTLPRMTVHTLYSNPEIEEGNCSTKVGPPSPRIVNMDDGLEGKHDTEHNNDVELKDIGVDSVQKDQITPVRKHISTTE